ncbi:MAG: hypothetical protein AB7S36_13240 [Planctomycetota bacterium]
MPVLGSIGDGTRWRNQPPCPSCNRSTRLAEHLHFILNHWAGHQVCRLTWHLLITDAFAAKLDAAGAIVLTRPIEQVFEIENPDAAPTFRLVEPGPVVPNRLKRQCSACNVSYENDSAWVRLVPRHPETGAINPSGALMFDTDVPQGPALFVLGRDHFAITDPLKPLFEALPDVSWLPVPVVRNPVENLGPAGQASALPPSW